MLSNWLLSALEPIELGSLVVAIIALLWMRLAFKWPFLLAALVSELMVDAILAWFLHRKAPYATYFYVYWLGLIALQALIRLGIITDIVRSFPAIGILPETAYWFVGIAGATMAVASALYCFFGSPHSATALSMHIKDSAVLFARCVSVAWLTFFVVMLASIKLVNLGWSPIGAGICNGVTARVCYATLYGELMMSKSPRVRLLGNEFESLCTIAVLLFWAYQFVRNSDPRATDVAAENPIVRHNLDVLRSMPERGER
jgi:hypothetical protein